MRWGCPSEVTAAATVRLLVSAHHIAAALVALCITLANSWVERPATSIAVEGMLICDGTHNGCV